MSDKKKGPQKDKKKKKIKELNYFKAMTAISEHAVSAANELKKLLGNLNDLPAKVDGVHAIESAADSIYHDIIAALNRAFVTPIEREDIKDLAHAVDDVVDAVEDVVLHFYMFNVTTIRPEAIRFCDLICEICKKLYVTMGEFENYKKSKKINELLVDLNRLEENGDVLYREAIRHLFTENNVPRIEVLKWKEIFDMMEKCCDACECCADMIEGVILKNS